MLAAVKRNAEKACEQHRKQNRTPADPGVADRNQDSDERDQYIELDLDFERPSDGVHGSNKCPEDEILHVERIR